MIKLFGKLALHHVEMFIDYINNPNVVRVTFRRDDRMLTKYINLSEFTDVWGGDHVLENVLEACLDEFLKDVTDLTRPPEICEFRDSVTAIDNAYKEFVKERVSTATDD